jgi:thiol-disulfide isomerase/thioredoxin
MTHDPTVPSADPASPRSTERPRPQSNSNTKVLFVLLAGIAGMVIFLFVHLSKDGRIHPGPTPAHAECAKGQSDCLPDLNYVDTTGVAYPHDSLAGKVVLVNFWATWCHPCEKEIPDLSKAYEKYKAKGVVFLGEMIDSPAAQQLLTFQSDHDMTYPVVRATRDLMALYNNPDAYPTTYVYDRGGKQVYSHLGPVREAELDSLLSRLAAQN